MTRRAVFAPLFAIAALLPAAGRAQTFTTAKWNIGGEGGTDYITAEQGTGRVFVSRGTHIMVVDGPTGKVLGDIPDTPRTHGVGLAPKANHGFTTNAGDSTVTMFDLKTLAFIKKIKIEVGGLDGITYDESDDVILLTNHSKIGTLTAINPKTGDIVATVELEDNGPEGAVADGKGRIFVNNENKNTIQVVDVKTWKAVASWPTAPCVHPTGIAYDAKSNRIFTGCGTNSIVVDAKSGAVVATIAVGEGVDALGYDASEKLIYIPSGRGGNVVVAHMDAPDKYTVVATVPTFAGAKTIAVDAVNHMAYLFQPEFGPPPPPAPGTPAPAPGGRGGPRGPIVAAWFIAIKH